MTDLRSADGWLPCPFCGGTDIRHDRHVGADRREHSGQDVYSMCCYQCGATFPSRYRLELLREAWNKRVTHEPPSGERGDMEQILREQMSRTAAGRMALTKEPPNNSAEPPGDVGDVPDSRGLTLRQLAAGKDALFCCSEDPDFDTVRAVIAAVRGAREVNHD